MNLHVQRPPSSFSSTNHPVVHSPVRPADLVLYVRVGEDVMTLQVRRMANEDALV